MFISMDLYLIFHDFYRFVFEVFQNPDKEIRKEFLVKSNEASYVNECGTEHV